MAISTELCDSRKYRRYTILILIYACIFQFTVKTEEVTPAEYPFFTTLLRDAEVSCGATLITSSFLITACHCLLKTSADSSYQAEFKYPHELQDAKSIVITAGNVSEQLNGQTRTVKEIQVHPECKGDASAVVYDYGLIEVEYPFNLNTGKVEVIDFFGQQNFISQVIEEPDNLDCFSLGFELIRRADDFWHLGPLTKGNASLKKGDWCSNTINEISEPENLVFHPDLLVCATEMDSPGVCEPADSGGLLICDTGEDVLIIGLSSGRDRPYCGKEVPHVYGRMDVAIRWVYKILDPDGHSKMETSEMTSSGEEPTMNMTTTPIGPTDPTLTESVIIPGNDFGRSGETTEEKLASCFPVSSNFRLIIFTTSMAAVISPCVTFYSNT